MPIRRTNRVANRRRQSGFSILEMLLASVILMVGIVSVVQLVPTSLQLNASNRFDTLATVIAQRELDQMVSQPLTVDSFTDAAGQAISLGGANLPGSPLIQDFSGAEQIDFSADPVSGFSITNYADVSGAIFDVRWAVIPQTAGGKVISRRIIIGVRQVNANQISVPATLDTWIWK